MTTHYNTDFNRALLKREIDFYRATNFVPEWCPASLEAVINALGRSRLEVLAVGFFEANGPLEGNGCVTIRLARTGELVDTQATIPFDVILSPDAYDQVRKFHLNQKLTKLRPKYERLSNEVVQVRRKIDTYLEQLKDLEK